MAALHLYASNAHFECLHGHTNCTGSSYGCLVRFSPLIRLLTKTMTASSFDARTPLVLNMEVNEKKGKAKHTFIRFNASSFLRASLVETLKSVSNCKQEQMVQVGPNHLLNLIFVVCR